MKRLNLTLKVQPDEIKQWLEWAGKNLLSLPIKNPAPGKIKAMWPDYPQDPNIIYNVHNIRLTPTPPSSTEIQFIDKILELILLVPETNIRRVLQVRSLIGPINNKQLYSWEKISRTMLLPARHIKSLHKKGLIFIASTITEEKALEIKKFYERATK